MKKILAILLVCGFAVTFYSCEPEANEAENKIEEVGEDMEDAAEEVEEDIEDAVDDGTSMETEVEGEEASATEEEVEG